ncbi:MAG: endonuclease III [Clostridia bacterium]|nr:endonuclease III [Clostridia bacterium]
MAKQEEIFNYLDELYPKPKCALNFSSSYELLVAVVLSAQCTDKRVNLVTADLFKLAHDAQTMVSLGEDKLKTIIRPCGFYNNKAKAIISLSKDLLEKFNGKVPSTLEELTTLKGVGRKTANVMLATAFNGQAIAVDTHVHRISKRLGLTTNNSTPLKCEQDLLNLVPYERRSKFHHQMIWFGREHCKAINPKCETCKLKNICKYKNKKKV